MPKRSYTDAALREAVASSTSVRQVLLRLNLAGAGGNYAGIAARIQDLGIETSHFKGQGWRKGSDNPVVPARPLAEVLREGTCVQSYKLKRRLLTAGLKSRRCESCRKVRWLGHPIPLELHHINGDQKDNRLDNLRLVCPNCHALTSNYRGKKLAKCRDETAPS
jgi:hypothetical protein